MLLVSAEVKYERNGPKELKQSIVGLDNPLVDMLRECSKQNRCLRSKYGTECVPVGLARSDGRGELVAAAGEQFTSEPPVALESAPV